MKTYLILFGPLFFVTWILGVPFWTVVNAAAVFAGICYVWEKYRAHYVKKHGYPPAGWHGEK